ncbi:MAG: NAD(P)H-dependent oxidoreductase subunit E [bacterium]|nr:NAD(P)H-dependent oxidoreductase subunit E [bacterium]
MKKSFQPETLQKIEREKQKYPDKLSALLPTLWWAQAEFEYFDTETMDYIAEVLGISKIRVYEAVTFYTMFHRKPVGKYHFQVCHNIACSLLGAEHIIQYLQKKLKIELDEVSKDGLFSITRVECLGSCGTAPVLQMNDRYYENLNESKIDFLIEELIAGRIPETL